MLLCWSLCNCTRPQKLEIFFASFVTSMYLFFITNQHCSESTSVIANFLLRPIINWMKSNTSSKLWEKQNSKLCALFWVNTYLKLNVKYIYIFWYFLYHWLDKNKWWFFGSETNFCLYPTDIFVNVSHVHRV